MIGFIKPLFVGWLVLLSLSTAAQVNLNNGLIAYYPFDGNFNDASGNGYNGLAMNGATLTTDQWGHQNAAALFDGIDDWVDVSTANFTLYDVFSIAFRYSTDRTQHQCILAKANYLTNSGVQFQVAFNHPNSQYSPGLYLGTNHTGTCVNNGSGDLDDYTKTIANPTVNTWYCVVMIFDHGVKSIYVNGVLAAQHTVAAGTYPNYVDSCAGTNLRLGLSWQGDPRYFSGKLDEVRLYNRALNTQEVDSFCSLIPSSDTIINRYAAVMGKGKCENSFTVDDATGFDVGDTIMMIQMKGAVVDSSNTASFGTVLDYRGAGNYDYNVIQSKNGQDLSLKYTLTHTYNIPDGRVQFVKVVNAQNYTVNRPHTCMAWDGKKGGVFALNVANTLTLNNDIHVDGKGFAGGQVSTSTIYACDRSDFFYDATNNYGAMKGEGIAEVSSAKMYGRGALANGGGGGNSTNAGGGGGSNATAGGVGGFQWYMCTQNPTFCGVGGAGLSYTGTDKVFLGGGGGAGHQDGGETDPGGNGGGLIYINANTIVANNNASLVADGDDCANINSAAGTGGDGQSGGGGGGTIMLHVANFISYPTLITRGGKGGDIFVAQTHGPGGGGSGGTVLLSPATYPSASINVSGGIRGVMSASNNPNGATSGNYGVILDGYSFPAFPTVVATSNIASLSFNDTIVGCFSRTFGSNANSLGIGIASIEWDLGGTTSTAINPTHTFPGYGTYTVRLTITDSNGCSGSVSRNIFIEQVDFANATVLSGDSVLNCETPSVRLSSTGAASYLWSPGRYCDDSLSSSPVVTPPETTLFSVAATDADGCTDTANILVVVKEDNILYVPNVFTPNADGQNDVLKVKGVCDFQLEEFSIYNRWGHNVFFTRDPAQGWDGRLKGKYADRDVYVYYVKGKTKDGKEVLKKGNVTLLR